MANVNSGPVANSGSLFFTCGTRNWSTWLIKRHLEAIMGGEFPDFLGFLGPLKKLNFCHFRPRASGRT
jgi:hypothetical protein